MDISQAKSKAPAMDGAENTASMEPLLVGETSSHRGVLTDLAIELAQESASFRNGLPASLVASLADLVRAMNCYYSNLIEGHDTHPIDIERALRKEYSNDPRKCDLQKEAEAHIAVQKWIDEGNLVRREVTTEGICEVHRRFCELLPPEMLFVEDPESHEKFK